MAAYYNEIDPFAAAWLRELIKRNLINVGEVDERSIEVVQPDDLRGFTQCHFFAGIGVWSYALRRAGWDDARPVWTGSCPCQPFSDAGKGEGFSDKRHLWPHLFRLIRECRPDVCFGEQVASKDGLAWLDLVSTDLEGADYAFAAADICAAGVGAPHVRQRLYWLADALSAGRPQGRPESGHRSTSGSGGAGPLDNADGERRGEARHPEREQGVVLLGGSEPARRLDDADDARLQGHGRPLVKHDAQGREGAERHQRPLGFWSDAEWINCRDGKARPVEPGSFPLAHGAPARVGRLRGYGNAIVAEVAETFIQAYLDVRGGVT